MKIGSRDISQSSPYVIAEIGVNHDGDLDRALALTRAAANCGADAVKFQFFEADRLMGQRAELAQYQANAGATDPHAMLRALELTAQQLASVAQCAHEAGIHAIVSVFSVELVAPMLAIPWDAYKCASPDIIHPLLQITMARTGKPLILSTGASTGDEVRRAVNWHPRLIQHERLAVLQCVSAYPTPRDAASLGGIPALALLLAQDRFHPTLGYSDHTAETDTGALAVRCGAAILEKHFTDDPSRQGPDHAASLDPTGMSQYIQLAREAGQSPPLDRTELYELSKADPRIGPLEKQVLDIERDVRRVSRQSITAARNIPKGKRLELDDLTIARPGTGIEPWELLGLAGAEALMAVDAGTPLQWDWFEPAESPAGTSTG